MSRRPTLKKECSIAVGNVLGRNITKKESEDIVQGIKAFVYQIKKKEPNLTRQEYIDKAAQSFAKRIKDEAARKVRNAKLQITAVGKIRTYYTNMRKKGASANEAARRTLDHIDKIRIGVAESYKAGLLDFLKATDPRIFKLFEDDYAALGVLNEIAGVNTGNPVWRAAAQAWTKTIDSMRQRFVAAGGKLEEFEDWIHPQNHDAAKVMQATRVLAGKVDAAKMRIKGLNPKSAYDMDANKAAWIAFIMPKLDRDRYLNSNFKRMSDSELRAMLGKVFENIITSGDRDAKASKVTGGRHASLANSRNEHRVLHFKNQSDWFDYNRKFGQNPSILGTMLSHIDSLSRDITLLEEMGPSPTSTYNTLVRMAEVENHQQSTKTGKVIPTEKSLLESMWANLNGSAMVTKNVGVANFWQGFRNLQVAGKLGGALISSFTDIPAYFHTHHYNNVPFMQSAKMLVTSLNPMDKSDKQFAALGGIVGDELNSAASRFVETDMGHGITGKLADLTIRASLLSKWTDAVRRASSLTTMHAFSAVKNQSWGSLDGWMKERLELFGIDEKFWNVLQKAQPENYKGADFITKNSIMKLSDTDLADLGITRIELERYAGKYLGFVMDESFLASLRPDLQTRAIANGGHAKGTFWGEVSRSFMLFKSFPIGMMTRHWQRSKDLYRYKKQADGTYMAMASRTGYYASLIASTTLTAFVSGMFKDVLAGSDMNDPTSKETWKRAFTSGGGAGFAGDILVSAMDTYKYGRPAIFNFFGPVASTLLDAYTIADKYKDNKDAGANSLRLIRSNMPLVNLWYTKQAVNHCIFNQVQEMLNPGYHDRIEKQRKKRQGIGYWWRPTDITPRRMPKFGKMPD